MRATNLSSSIRHAFLVFSALCNASCIVGTQLSTLAPAKGGAGISVRLQLLDGSRPVVAELVAVSDSSLVLADRDLIGVAYFRGLVTATFEGAGVTLHAGRLPTPIERERLRRLSRYPAGISPSLERALLDAYRVDSLRAIHK